VRRGPAGALLTDLREEALHAEAEAFERGGEEQIVLVAIAAAFPADIFACRASKPRRIGRPRTMSRFSKGMAATCARWTANKVRLVGSVAPAAPMRRR
jgi:hypothetical protein